LKNNLTEENMFCCKSGKKSVAAALLLALVVVAGYGCASEDNGNAGHNWGVEAFCKQYVMCCDDVGEELCVEIDDKDQMKEICEINSNAAIDAMENNEPEICDEWFELQAKYFRCVGKDDLDCDEWIGDDMHVDNGDFGNYGDICDKECEDIIEYAEDFEVGNCGSLLNLTNVDDDNAADVCVINRPF